MSQRRPVDSPLPFPAISVNRLAGAREFSDTDPQMLHAMWLMGFGADPDKSLEEVEQAEIVYDKFAPGVAKR
jgi:hypothetical protein